MNNWLCSIRISDSIKLDIWKEKNSYPMNNTDFNLKIMKLEQDSV